MRTPILRSSWVTPALWLFGGTESRSYVETESDTLHVRFGFLFDERIPFENIVSIERTDWPLLSGIGWRTNFVDSIGVVGSYSNVVKLRLSPSIRMSILFPVKVEFLYVSVEDPDALIAEVRRRIVARGT